MAIKKPGSRFTDRNKIRKMHAEGYSATQIADTVSITMEHVQYVIDKWDADEEAWRNRELAARDAERAAAKQAAVPENAPISIDDAERARIREAARRELLEELSQPDQPDEVEEVVVEEVTVDVEEEVADQTEDEAPEEEPKKPRRRRKPAEGEE
jgi:hypothetical protein